MPDILVILFTWDRGAVLKECLRTMHRKPGMEFRLWVVDNGSAFTNMWSPTSGIKHLDILLEWYRRGKIELLLLNKRNLGTCHAPNQLMAVAKLTAIKAKVSRPDFVLQTVDDSIFHPGWLSECHRTLLDCENYARGRVLIVSPFHCRHSNGRTHAKVKTIDRYQVAGRTYEIKQCVSGNTWFMRGNTWLDVFSFYPTERLKGGWDWAKLRIVKQMGAKCAVTPDEMVTQHPEAVGTGKWQRSRNWR